MSSVVTLATPWISTVKVQISHLLINTYDALFSPSVKSPPHPPPDPRGFDFSLPCDVKSSLAYRPLVLV